MKAIRIHAYGSASGVRLEEIPVPEAGPSDVLVRVVAAGVNPVDWKLRAGAMARAVPRELPLTLGWDAAGTVIAAGRDVSALRPGDAVFFYAAFARGGTYAEYVAVSAAEAALKPRTMSFASAAALPMAAQAAWTAIVETAQVGAGMRVLVHGAAGAVGSAAVQFAREAGAEVFATASGAGLELVAGLGAARVIDHRSERFEGIANDLDVVLDTVGGETQEASWATLRPGGLLVATTAPPSPARAEAAGVRATFLFTPPRGAVLAQIARRVDAGRLHAFVGRELALDDAGEAHRLGEAGRAGGKMVLHVAPPPRTDPTTPDRRTR